VSNLTVNTWLKLSIEYFTICRETELSIQSFSDLWPLKELYNELFTHSYTIRRRCQLRKATTSRSGAANVSSSARTTLQGIEPATGEPSARPTCSSRLPCMPRGSWLMAMAALFCRMARASLLKVRRSLDMMRGAAMMAHSAIWARASSTLRPKFPMMSYGDTPVKSISRDTRYRYSPAQWKVSNKSEVINEPYRGRSSGPVPQQAADRPGWCGTSQRCSARCPTSPRCR